MSQLKINSNKYITMIKRLEWVEYPTCRDLIFCPICGEMYARFPNKKYIHKPNCELAALLKEVEQ